MSGKPPENEGVLEAEHSEEEPRYTERADPVSQAEQGGGEESKAGSGQGDLEKEGVKGGEEKRRVKEEEAFGKRYLLFNCMT